MDKTVSISLGGYNFTLEAEAYTVLNAYLDSVATQLGRTPEANEIIASIEERLAELLGERMTDGGVITERNVQEAIKIIGSPEDITDGADHTPRPAAQPRTRLSGRLYRDPDNRIIGGVCAGIAARLDIPLWVPRLIIGLSTIFYGFGPLIYIILWIAMPMARTPLQKLELHGEPITFDSLEKKTREHYQKAREALRPENHQDTKGDVATFFTSIGLALGTVFLGLLKVLIKILGVALILGSVTLGVGIGIALVSIAIDPATVLTSYPFPWPWFDIINSWDDSVFSIILAGIILIVPLFALFILGLRCLVKFKIPLVFNLSILGIWIAAIAMLGIYSLRTYKYELRKTAGSVETVYPLPLHKQDTVCLGEELLLNDTLHEVDTMRKVKTISGKKGHIQINSKTSKDFYEHFTHIRREINVTTSSDTIPTLRILRKSYGLDKEDAQSRAAAIEYTPAISNGNITLPRPLIERVRSYLTQIVEVTLLLPEGYRLIIDPSMETNVWAKQEGSDYKVYLLPGQVYEMQGGKPTEIGTTIPPQSAINTP